MWVQILDLGEWTRWPFLLLTKRIYHLLNIWWPKWGVVYQFPCWNYAFKKLSLWLCFRVFSFIVCYYAWIHCFVLAYLSVCHTFRKHLNNCTLLWNFNIYVMLVLFVKCFSPFLILLNFQNNLVRWVIFSYYICWKPRIQIFKWFPQGNKSKLGNFILLIPQIYCSEVLSSGDTSLKQLIFLPTGYNIKTRFFRHKSEALWDLASTYLVSLIFFTTLLLIW